MPKPVAGCDAVTRRESLPPVDTKFDPVHTAVAEAALLSAGGTALCLFVAADAFRAHAPVFPFLPTVVIASCAAVAVPPLARLLGRTRWGPHTFRCIPPLCGGSTFAMLVAAAAAAWALAALLVVADVALHRDIESAGVQGLLALSGALSLLAAWLLRRAVCTAFDAAAPCALPLLAERPGMVEAVAVVIVSSIGASLSFAAEFVFPPALRAPTAALFAVLHVGCGAVVHLQVGWRSTPGYLLFSPFQGGVKSIAAGLVGWLAFSVALLLALVLAATPAAAPAPSGLFAANGVLGLLCVASLLLLTRLPPASTGASTPSATVGGGRAAATGGEVGVALRSRTLLGRHGCFLASSLATAAATIYAAVSLGAVRAVQLDPTVWEPAVTVALRLGSSALAGFPPLTHAIGCLAFGHRGYDLWQPFRGPPTFVALQALGWALYTVGIVGLAVVGTTTSGPAARMVGAALLLLAQFVLHASIRAYAQGVAQVPSAPTATIHATTSKTTQAASERPLYVRGELATGALLSLSSAVLAASCDFLRVEAAPSATAVPRGPLLLLSLGAYAVATPLAHVARRHQEWADTHAEQRGVKPRPEHKHSGSLLAPFSGSAEHVALQAVGWALYAAMLLLQTAAVAIAWGDDDDAPSAPSRRWHTAQGLAAQLPFALVALSTVLHATEAAAARRGGRCSRPDESSSPPMTPIVFGASNDAASPSSPPPLTPSSTLPTAWVAAAGPRLAAALAALTDADMAALAAAVDDLATSDHQPRSLSIPPAGASTPPPQQVWLPPPPTGSGTPPQRLQPESPSPPLRNDSLGCVGTTVALHQFVDTLGAVRRALAATSAAALARAAADNAEASESDERARKLQVASLVVVVFSAGCVIVLCSAATVLRDPLLHPAAVVLVAAGVASAVVSCWVVHGIIGPSVHDGDVGSASSPTTGKRRGAYRVFMPFAGGSVFVAWQSLGWAALSACIVVGARAALGIAAGRPSDMQDPGAFGEAALVLAVAFLGVAAQTAIRISLGAFVAERQRCRIRAPSRRRKSGNGESEKQARPRPSGGALDGEALNEAASSDREMDTLASNASSETEEEEERHPLLSPKQSPTALNDPRRAPPASFSNPPSPGRGRLVASGSRRARRPSVFVVHAEGFLSMLVGLVAFMAFLSYEPHPAAGAAFAGDARGATAAPAPHPADALVRLLPAIVGFAAVCLALPLAVVSLRKSAAAWRTEQEQARRSRSLDEDDEADTAEGTTPDGGSRRGSGRQSSPSKVAAVGTDINVSAAQAKTAAPPPPMQWLEHAAFFFVGVTPILLMYGAYFVAARVAVGVAMSLSAVAYAVAALQVLVLTIIFARSAETLVPQWLLRLRYLAAATALYTVPTSVGIGMIGLPLLRGSAGAFGFLFTALAMTLLPASTVPVVRLLNVVGVASVLWWRAVAATDAAAAAVAATVAAPIGVAGDRGGFTASLLTSIFGMFSAGGDTRTTVAIAAAVAPFVVAALEDMTLIGSLFFYAASYKGKPEESGAFFRPWFVRFMRRLALRDTAEYFRFGVIVDGGPGENVVAADTSMNVAVLNEAAAESDTSLGKLTRRRLQLADESGDDTTNDNTAAQQMSAQGDPTAGSDKNESPGAALLGRPLLLGAPRQPAIFAFHPHGIFPATIVWFSLLPQWAALVGTGTRLTIHAASVLFRTPFLRDFCMSLGGRAVTQSAIERSLAQGNAVAVVPGGQAELVLSRCSDTDVRVVTRHFGFVRMAIRNQVPLVPLWCFGEHDILSNISMPELQRWSLKRLGFPFPIMPYGRWLTPVPNPARLTVVVGRPISPPTDPALANDPCAVEALATEYYAELQRVFYAHRERAGYPKLELRLEPRLKPNEPQQHQQKQQEQRFR